jgi:LysR family transcriptional regulator, transcriptional activator for bauABCD operon
MPLSREPQLDPFDIKLLRLFLKVVECGGFSGAQAELNVSASTISTQMAMLESRLGMRLCDRGRVGFRLTEQGRRVCAAAQRLEGVMCDFRSEIGELRGKLVGELHIGVADSTVTNPDCRLHAAISRFTGRDHTVHITLHVNEPAMIEKLLIDGKLNVGITAFYHHVPQLVYERLFFEEHGLYCGRMHPFFGREPGCLSVGEVMAADYVARGYMTERHTGPLAGLNVAATTFNMEATLAMIRSGAYLGHLPRHYARSWEDSGELRELRPERFEFVSEFEMAIRKGADRPLVVGTFLDDLRQAQGMDAPLASKQGRPVPSSAPIRGSIIAPEH